MNFKYPLAASIAIGICVSQLALCQTPSGTKYGNTSRLIHIWDLNRQGNWHDAKKAAQQIAADSRASKEERCSAEECVAYDCWILGENAEASKALQRFEEQRRGLTIDPGVIHEANRIKVSLSKHRAKHKPRS